MVLRAKSLFAEEVLRFRWEEGGHLHSLGRAGRTLEGVRREASKVGEPL